MLPPEEQSAIPPKQITDELAERTGAADAIEHDEAALGTAAVMNHFGYGAAMGLAYGALARGVVRPRVWSGVVFGTGVWAASYLGWLPLMNMRAAATREPAGRNAMTIASHLVWGGALGGLTGFLMGRGK